MHIRQPDQLTANWCHIIVDGVNLDYFRDIYSNMTPGDIIEPFCVYYGCKRRIFQIENVEEHPLDHGRTLFRVSCKIVEHDLHEPEKKPDTGMYAGWNKLLGY